MRGVYRLALRVFPEDFGRALGPAMAADFNALVTEQRRRGWWHAAAFTAGECAALVGAAPREWFAKLVAPPFHREMVFHDASCMRPPMATKQFWYGL
jgi:hypothetical protein